MSDLIIKLIKNANIKPNIVFEDDYLVFREIIPNSNYLVFASTMVLDYYAYSGTSGRRIRKHPDTKPEVSGHFAG